MKGLRTLKRRRREGKTDYKARLGLLKSGLVRIVIRKSNKYFVVQAIESHEAQDKVILTVKSRDLLNEGWDKKFVGSLKSIPAGYLTGILFSKKADKSKKYIVDLGLERTIHGNRIFSVVAGLVVGGMKIDVNEKALPPEERLNGEHLKEDVKKNIEKVKLKLVSKEHKGVKNE